MKNWKIILKSVKKYWFLALITPIVMIGEAISELQIPALISDLINYLDEVNKGLVVFEMNALWILGGKLLLFSVISLILGLLGAITAARSGAGFAANLKSDMFKKIQTFSFLNIEKYHSSSLITRMNTDVNWLKMNFQMTIRLAVRTPTMFIYALVKAINLNLQISTAFLVAIPIMVIVFIIFFSIAHPIFEKIIKKTDELNSVLEENIRGIRVVKSYTNEDIEIKKFTKVNDYMYKNMRKAQMIVNSNGPIMNLVMYTIIVLIMVLGSLTIAKGNTDFNIGEIQELISYAMQILTSLMMLSMVVVFFVISKPSQKRVAEILREEATIRNSEEPIMAVDNGAIEFKNVMFKYNETSEKYVLNKINLKINSGETIGIIGTTGSSKSTLVSMIPRLYDVLDGELLVADHNVKEYDIDTLRDAVSIVLQKNVLFSGSIKDNLLWGDAKATDEEIVQAAKLSQSEEFIEQMPDKYSTYIEQGGTNLSGGQKQRLCIARAILKHPKILILDDSMSAVDTKTDSKIREGLKEYLPEITKIIVAQRCQSVMDADKIIIIDNGEILAIGKHEELLKSSSAYQDVYYSQNKEEAHYE